MAEAKSDASGSAGAAAAAASSGTWVSPGDRLGGEEEFAGGVGAGCYVRAGRVHASIVGICTVSGGAKPVVSVVAPHIAAPVVPVVGSIVTAKVIRITRQVARVSIVCVGETPLKERFSGIVRRENIRAEEIDRVEVQHSMRPGDVIKAEVVSLGDARSYYLSTAKVDLGVVFARSATSGTPMMPISWKEMQCPVTKAKELRKVAKGISVVSSVAKTT